MDDWKKTEIWYALRCDGFYVPFLYAVDECLDKERIRSTKEDCQKLCDELNEKVV